MPSTSTRCALVVVFWCATDDGDDAFLSAFGSFPFRPPPTHPTKKNRTKTKKQKKVHHGWVRDVTVLNADAGVYLWGCHWTSVTGVTLGTTAYRGDARADRWEYKDTNGHRGVWSEFGGDNLFQGFVSFVCVFVR